MLFHISCCLLVLISIIQHGDARPEPQGNSMNPKNHATELRDEIHGTNVPEDEKSIEAPIEDQHEIDKLKQTVHDIGENGHNPGELPVIGDFAKKNMHLKSPTAAPDSDNSTTTLSSVETGTTLATTGTSTEVVLTTTAFSISSTASESLNVTEGATATTTPYPTTTHSSK